MLVACLGCGTGTPQGPASTHDDGPDTGVATPFAPIDLEAAASSTPSGSAAAEDEGDASTPLSCPGGRPKDWSPQKPTTVPGTLIREAYFGLSGLVVDRAGTATVLFEAAGWDARTANDPPAAGDPQDPSLDVDDTYAYDGTHLGVDRAGTQTLAYFEGSGFYGDQGMEVSDIAITDRPAHGDWSQAPTRVRDRTPVRVDLAVNEGGAAVLVWDEPGRFVGRERLRAVYRPAAAAAWTDLATLPVRDFISFEATIDDAGRALLGYARPYGKTKGVYVMRRSPAGRWGHPHLLSRGNPALPNETGNRLFGITHAGSGAAVVTHGPVDGDFTPTDVVYTTRMNPDGTWEAPVSQPHRLGLNGLQTDAHGRTLLAGWDGRTLWGRWSRPDGTWRKPFVIASHLADRSRYNRWGLWPQLDVNRRGDAIATWVRGRTAPTTWVRFQPAGRGWERPRRIVPAERPTSDLQMLRATLGDCGHAAIAWTSPDRPHRVHIRRATPQP
ncbi:hypothetical protein [Nocardioides sp. P5_E3]